ncbi:terminase [Bacillus obstructivus]|uniref:Terminase n=2 Tax=Bacillaceae TaxID=186817 RepID=A0A8E2LGH4_9BACI|nr:terminase [Bacillus obstructivus]OOP69952.1 terminase [Heyndrickxia oleronia]
MSIKKELELGKVLVVILDGNQRKAKWVEAVEHGFTIIETAKGKATKIKFEEGELF